MKKIFNALFIATITFGPIPNLLANSSYETQVNNNNNNNNQPIILHYSKEFMNNNSGIEVFNDWGLKNEDWRILYTFNLQSINPSHYKKIKFWGKDSDFYTRISWGNKSYNGKKLNYYNKPGENCLYTCNDISKKIINAKIINANIDAPKVVNYKNSFLLQNTFVYYESFWGYKSDLKGTQSLAFTWYVENGNYYFQVLTYYKVTITNSSIGGGIFMGIGTGIELYND